MSDAESYLIRWRGKTTGPHTLASIERKLADHEIGMFHEIQSEGSWTTLDQFLSRRSAASNSTPGRIKVPLPTESQPGEAHTLPAVIYLTPCRHWIFVALGLVLGFTGAHNFYVRRWPVGIAQALTTAATYSLGFGLIATWAWALLEIIFVQTDAKGVRLT